MAAALATTRLRAVAAAALCLGSGALLLPFCMQALLPMPRHLLPVLVVGYLAGAALMTIVVAISAWVSLWPATPYLDLQPGEAEPRGAEPREAKVAAMSFPARIATAGACAGQLAVVAGWLALTVAGEPPGLVLGTSLTTAMLVGLSWLLLYALGQRAIAPVLHRLRQVALPPGELLAGVTLRGRLAYALAVVISAGVLPAAVFAAGYLDHAHTEAEELQAARTAGWLMQAIRGLDEKSAAQVVEAVPLSYGFPGPWPEKELGAPPGATSNRAPGKLVIEPAHLQLPGGKHIYLPPSPPAEQPAGLLIAVALLLCLGVAVAVGGGVLVARDVAALTGRVQRYAEGPAGLASSLRTVRGDEQPMLATVEARQGAALERLMDRMRRLHVDSYLAIERTVDARRAKSQFLASMSHDLRAPLGSVLGFAELLSGGYEGTIAEGTQRRLLAIHQTGRRLLRLLSEILDTAKVESQTIELHPRRCAMPELLAQAVAEARRGRLQDDIPVVHDIAPGLRPIYVDPVRFPQALAHLIGHVLDSTGAEPGVHQLRISVREAPQSQIEVEVGVERAPSSAAGPQPVLALGTVGLGLALPLARRLIALHGGTIDVSPRPRPALVAVVPARTPPAT